MTDKNLELVVKLLNNKDIFYWIGQGTLLGITRDNKLIEWDHDIDICLWDHEYKKKYEFVKLLEKGGFKYRDDLGFGEPEVPKEGAREALVAEIRIYAKGF